MSDEGRLVDGCPDHLRITLRPTRLWRYQVVNTRWSPDQWGYAMPGARLTLKGAIRRARRVAEREAKEALAYKQRTEWENQEPLR